MPPGLHRLDLAGGLGSPGAWPAWPHIPLACSCSLCGMVQFCGDVRKKVLLQLMLLLCHPFPVVSVGPYRQRPLKPAHAAGTDAGWETDGVQGAL